MVTMVLEFDKKWQVHEESDKMSFKTILDNTPIHEKLLGFFSALKGCGYMSIIWLYNSEYFQHRNKLYLFWKIITLNILALIWIQY